MDFPVILVANKTDQIEDRIVTKDEGLKRSQEIGCACFHEISVRESVDEAQGVFRDVYRFCRFLIKFPNLRRSKSDSMKLSLTLHSEKDPDEMISRLYQMYSNSYGEKKRSITLFGRSRSAWNEGEESQGFEVENGETNATLEPFRSRAKTDGNLLMSQNKKWRIPSGTLSPPVVEIPTYHVRNRRNSISMRGHVSY